MVQPAIDEGIKQKKKQRFSAFLFFLNIEMVTLPFVLYVCV